MAYLIKRQTFYTHREREVVQQLQHTAAAARIPVGDDGHVRVSTSAHNDEDDEDTVRRYWLLVVEQAVLQASARMAALQQEVGLLRHRASLPRGQAPPPTQPPAALLQQLHAAADALQGSIGMVDLQQQVCFQPNQLMPENRAAAAKHSCKCVSAVPCIANHDHRGVCACGGCNIIHHK